jgi:hypothetical protein
MTVLANEGIKDNTMPFNVNTLKMGKAIKDQK